MRLGGPVWHASARGASESLSWALAERALRGVGDASLGEWRETGHRGIVHLRRRLTDGERSRAGSRGRLEVRDIRGTEEEQQRLKRLVRESPHLQEALG